MQLTARDVPTRLAAGAYILHSGVGKARGGEDQARGVHAMASGAFPFLRKVPPVVFLRALGVCEIGVGSALLLPFVPTRVAGAALTAFAGGLVAMYARTPALHGPGSIWPTAAGTAVSKDVWLLGIGASLLIDGFGDRSV
jgi:uncharacterized membrane protein YphA (DoxX/SURF4 family)